MINEVKRKSVRERKIAKGKDKDVNRLFTRIAEAHKQVNNQTRNKGVNPAADEKE